MLQATIRVPAFFVPVYYQERRPRIHWKQISAWFEEDDNDEEQEKCVCLSHILQHCEILFTVHFTHPRSEHTHQKWAHIWSSGQPHVVAPREQLGVTCLAQASSHRWRSKEKCYSFTPEMHIFSCQSRKSNRWPFCPKLTLTFRLPTLPMPIYYEGDSFKLSQTYWFTSCYLLALPIPNWCRHLLRLTMALWLSHSAVIYFVIVRKKM